jgi:hypothetical protein
LVVGIPEARCAGIAHPASHAAGGSLNVNEAAKRNPENVTVRLDPAARNVPQQTFDTPVAGT